MSKKRRLYIALNIMLAILMLFDIILLLIMANMQQTPQQATGGVVMLDPNASDERPSDGTGSAPGVTVAGFSALTMPAGLSIIPIDLYNPIENNGLYYLTFEMRMPDDSEQGYEVLFKTLHVAPGKHIYQVELSHALPAGEYTAQLLIQPYRMSNLTPTNNVSAVVKLKVV